MASLTRPHTPLSEALKPRKSNVLPLLILVLGMVIALGFAGYGWFESRRTETVVVALTAIPFGRQITAEMVGTIELPLHRPTQLAGLTSPGLVVGKYAARDITPDDLFNPALLLAAPPDQPVYPNGQQLNVNMVPLPFSTQTIGPLTHHDLVNIGFSDASGDPALCAEAQAAAGSAPRTTPAGEAGRPYACRMLSGVRVLYVENGVAYLELTPFQAHSIWALQAAGLPLWGERYGAVSDILPALDRLDLAAVDSDRLTAAAPEPGALPGSGGVLPGEVTGDQ